MTGIDLCSLKNLFWRSDIINFSGISIIYVLAPFCFVGDVSHWILSLSPSSQDKQNIFYKKCLYLKAFATLSCSSIVRNNYQIWNYKLIWSAFCTLFAILAFMRFSSSWSLVVFQLA